MQSPRRSPRISAESLKRQSSTGLGKARASAGAYKADKENDPNDSPAAKKTKPIRRAHSLGGDALRRSGFEKDNTVSSVPSRRNVPGPRKSAIRALPPQVFASPSILAAEPLPQIRAASSSHSSDSISAFGGTELIDLMNSVGSSRSTQRLDEAQQLKLKQRSSMPSVKQDKLTAVVMTEITVEDDDNTVARKKRRVTFNPYQERTDFYLEEPTMHIKPSGEVELVTVENSTGFNGTSDMSLDSDDSGMQSMDESSMEITAAYMEQNDDADGSIHDDSAMEMTIAYGGLLDRTKTTASLPSGHEDIDDDSESEVQSSDEEQGISGSDRDMTVTMQFTSVYGADLSDSQVEQTKEMGEEEDEEMDMQLTEVDENSIRDGQEETVELAEEDDSAMEMTEIFDQKGESISPRKSLTHLASPKKMSASPRIGHEYCKISAADSPKHSLSAATMKALARRQSMSQSPIKPEISPSKSELGNSMSSKAAFRSPAKDANRKRQTLGSPTTRIASPPQQSSPAAKSPTTPSRVWKSFRRSQGGADTSSPARRISNDSQSPSRGGFGSPQRIAIKTKVVQPLVSDIEEKRQDDVSEKERWTMKQFFDSMDLGFLELSMPSKRKIDPKQESDGTQVDQTDLIKAACAQMPFLESLVGACEELKATVIDGRTIALEDEGTFFDNPPLYVAEMSSMTSAAERQRAVSAFRIQKAAARANALQAYYAWRTDRQYSDANIRKWEELCSKLEDDVNFVQEASKMVRGEILPVLQSRHQQLMQEVEEEKKRQQAIHKSDDEEMDELYGAMEEQGSILLEQQALYKKAKDGLERVQGQVKQSAARQKDAEKAIESAQMSYNSIAICTKEEAIRLARQTKHLETLHLWTLCRASLGEVVLKLDECLTLTLCIQKAAVSSARIELRRGGQLWQDTLQQAVDERLSSSQAKVQPAEIVRFITTAWTRLRHLTSVYDTLLARFPAEMDTFMTIDDKIESGIIIRASVLLPRRKSKVIVEARCGLDRLLNGRVMLFQLDDISATCVYGSVDAPAIAAQIADCVTVGSSAGGLTKAILEAVETFD